MGDDVLATQGARASATIICTTLNQINLFGPCTLKSYRGMGVVGMSNVSTVFLVIIWKKKKKWVSLLQTWCIYCGVSCQKLFNFGPHWTNHGPVVDQKWMEMVVSGHYLEKLFNFGPQWMTRAGPILTACGPVMIENGSNGWLLTNLNCNASIDALCNQLL